jgi:hypothetical protein
MAHPDAILQTLRQLLAQMDRHQWRDAQVTTALADDLAFWFDQLDDHLSRGGVLPREWNVRPQRSADVEGWDMPREEFVRLGSRFARLIPNYDRGRARRAAARHRTKARRRKPQ